MEPTAKVIVRHAATCPDREKGSDHRKCNCRKSLVVYDGTTRDKHGKLINKIITAKTRSWSKAEKSAQDWIDSFDPDKQELKRLRAEKERKQVRIEEAVALHCADLIARLGDNGTVALVRSMLGHVNPDTKQIERSGHLFTWLDKQIDRPTFISEITPTHLTEWRASWTFGSDLTARHRWGLVVLFFKFCETQGWIDDSPARKIRPLRAAKGNRTAIFTDKEYDKILDAVALYDPENVPALTRKNWQQRLLAFLQLMRWSGMDLADAVQFTPDKLDDAGVLRYRRQKTKTLATVPLPGDVASLLRGIPMERDSVGPEMPFRQVSCTLGSDTATWSRRLRELFTLAGITEVQTDIRKRPPHSKMLRDSFAVWHLTHGAKLHTVAKMMGHSKTATTEQSYLPWVKELEASMIDDARQSLKSIPKKRGRKVVQFA